MFPTVHRTSGTSKRAESSAEWQVNNEKQAVQKLSGAEQAVIVLTLMTYRGLWDLAKQNGAYVCLAKKFTTGEDLDKAIRRAVAFVGEMPKEDRYRPI